MDNDVQKIYQAIDELNQKIAKLQRYEKLEQRIARLEAYCTSVESVFQGFVPIIIKLTSILK